MPSRIPDNSTTTYLLSIQSDFLRAIGTFIVYQGVSYPANHKSLNAGEGEFIATGAGDSLNAADADLRSFYVAANDLVAGIPVGKAFLWHGINYSVLRNIPDDAGQTVGWILTAYRTPPAAPDTGDAAQLAQWPAPPAP